MSDRPTPDEAARALRDVGQREDQALDSVHEARWVRVVLGVAIFLFLAAPDFLGAHASTWTSPGFAVLVLGYAVLLRTRRGSALLGRPVQMRGDVVPRRFAVTARLVIAALVALSLLSLFVAHPHLDIPYWRTAMGAILGLLLIFFGRQLQEGLLVLVKRSRPHHDGAFDGSH